MQRRVFSRMIYLHTPALLFLNLAPLCCLDRLQLNPLALEYAGCGEADEPGKTVLFIKPTNP